MAIDRALRSNRLLAGLPDDEFGRLAPHFELFDGRSHDVMYGAGEEMSAAYFPVTAVYSLIATDSDGHAVELASVGSEGMIGLPGALSASRMIGEIIQQVHGSSGRIPMPILRAEIERRGTPAGLLDRYTVAILSSIGQGVLCNRHHPLEARAARWLLATHDRAGREDFDLTQDFLAIMLGVTRPQVSLAAATLRRAGVVSDTRGHARIWIGTRSRRSRVSATA